MHIISLLTLSTVVIRYVYTSWSFRARDANISGSVEGGVVLVLLVTRICVFYAR